MTAAEADPTQIVFPTLVRGSFDSRQPVAHRDFEDGTTYRLWRVSGEFKNDFYLQRYPADRQTLGVRFFNARAASDRLVYVLDRSGFDPLAADGLGNVGGGPEAVLRDAREAMHGGVRIDTIGLGAGQDGALLSALASESGGLYQAL